MAKWMDGWPVNQEKELFLDFEKNSLHPTA
jgi:hypothetical protein